MALLTIACDSRSKLEAASVPASRPDSSAPAPTPAVTASPEASALPVTADPVAVSQRNAERRRQHRITPGEDSAAASDKVGVPRSDSREPAREHEVPEGTILRVALDRTISSAMAKPGDSIRGELLDDLMADDGVRVASSGSRVTAKVEQATASGRSGGQAELTFRLSELTPPGGRTAAVASSAYEQRGETHTKHEAGYIAGGAAVGALIGQPASHDTKSTPIAAATGDLDVQVEAGRTVAFTLEQPLHLPGMR